MNFRKQYEKWLSFEKLDEQLRDELLAIKNDETQIKEFFYAPLSFGTAGLRGIIRAGINGMNIYTVSQATQGLSLLINKEKLGDRGVIIACDTRIKSEDFTRVCAEVLAANGIKVYLFDAPRPTPELSFAIRQMNAAAGINITASHNPKIYNGYKAYWSDGAQISPEQAEIISDAISTVDIFNDVKRMDFDQGVECGLITIIGKEIDEKYIETVLSHRINPKAIPEVCDTFKVVYTPFHGTGAKLVPEVLKRSGLKHLYTVNEQMIPDGSFPTVKSPNPEDKEGFALGIYLAKKHDCNLIVGTDPDADRVGVIIKTHTGDYIPLTGNQIGVMLISYIIEARKLTSTLPQNACVVKSIVSTPLADAICKSQGVAIMDVLTGFKFIGEKMTEFEKTGDFTYIFGFEESYGYLCGNYARDKDAVSAAMLIVEMAAFYAKKKKTLYDVLNDIFEEYGFYIESVQNLAFPGVDGQEKMNALMQNLRNNVPQILGGKKVLSFSDFKAGITKNSDGTQEKTGLPKSNVLLFITECGDKIFVRPSGTEPKVKIYYLANALTKSQTQSKIDAYTRDMTSLMEQ